MEILDRSNTSIQFQIGGDSRDRTGDLLLARQALSQLSYIPVLSSFVLVVGPSGLEPPTLRLSVVRSSQLSYGPISTAQGLVPSKLNNELNARCASHIAANAFAFAQTSDQDIRQYLFRLLVELYVALRAPCNSGRY